MDEKEPQSAAVPAEPTSTLPTAEPQSKDRGPGKGTWIFLTVAVAAIALIAILAAIFTPRAVGPVAEADYIGTWSAGMQSVTISADGEARGTDGCNGQGSRWTMGSNRINFDGFVGTMMACLTPEGKMLNGWLGQSSYAQLDVADSNQLIFYGQSGEQLGVMIRGAAPEPMPGRPMPTGDPMLPGPDDPTVPGPADDSDSLVDPMPGKPDPRPMFPKLPNANDSDTSDTDGKLR